MVNEKRDELFEINLGDGLIEVEDNTIGGAESVANQKGNHVTPQKTDEGVILNEDGSFDIDEFAEEITVASTEEGAAIIEKTEEKEKTSSKTSSSDSSPSSSPYLAFAKDRADEGVFLNFSDEDWKVLVERNEGDEAQALRELSHLSISKMVQSGVDEYKEMLTPEEKLFYEAKEKGLPVDKYTIAKRNYNKYSKITEDDIKEDIPMQEEIVAKGLEIRGFTPEEIKEEIEGYKALESLESRALKALPLLPKTYEKEYKDIENNASAQEESRKDQIRQRIAKMKMIVDNTPEIIPGIKLTKLARDKVMESMTLPVAKDKEGNPLNPVMLTRSKNPEGFEMMIHYYHALGLFNMDKDGKLAPDFSKIAKIEKTKAVDSMRSAFESVERTTVGKAPKIKTNEDDMTDFERAFRRIGS